MEYFVKCWGGAWNTDANPSIESDLKIKEGSYYFTSKNERDKFISYLELPQYNSQGIVYITKESDKLTHKRTILIATFRYNGKNYTVSDDFGYEYDEDAAMFMYTDGNFSCDCNRSLIIESNHPGTFEEVPISCGYTIEMIDCHIEYAD